MATEYLYSITPDDISINKWLSTEATKFAALANGNSTTPDDTSYVYCIKKFETNDGTIEDIHEAVGATINWVQYHFRCQLTGTPGNETISAGISNGVDGNN